ncbi:RNA polymerase sigma factor [Pseudactinotalea suaedae]|uniref:RNA polymerase sigma factor n=1 Tax=Pseudactinotalea suaedae TaxID=1524924 RepID=UPI0012E18049|nr:RNA polymerase sigma factor [Pseudactinotalea suaedae]
MTDAAAEARFSHLFAVAYDDLCRFVRRRITDGDDVVADTFLIAWRRLPDVPQDDGEARAWLFGTARKLMANRRRKDARMVTWAGIDQATLEGEPRADPSSAVDARIDLGRAFARLAGSDQECLALVAWDGLTLAQAAEVLGISANAFGVRLHRARRRLRAALAEPQSLTTLAAHVTSTQPRTDGSPS